MASAIPGDDAATAETSPIPAGLRRARFATGVVFAVHGAVAGSFAARVPWVASHVGVGVGGLGIALLMPGIGAMLAMPASGRLVHRHDLRPTLDSLRATDATLAVGPHPEAALSSPARVSTSASVNSPNGL